MTAPPHFHSCFTGPCCRYLVKGGAGPTMGIAELTNILREGGPWAISAVMIIAYLRKDRQIDKLHAERREDDRKTIETLTLFNGTVSGLKDTLNAFLNRLE